MSHPSLSLGENVLIVPAGYDVSMNEVMKYNCRFIKLISVLNCNKRINSYQLKVLYRILLLKVKFFKKNYIFSHCFM